MAKIAPCAMKAPASTASANSVAASIPALPPDLLGLGGHLGRRERVEPGRSQLRSGHRPSVGTGARRPPRHPASNRDRRSTVQLIRTPACCAGGRRRGRWPPSQPPRTEAELRQNRFRFGRNMDDLTPGCTARECLAACASLPGVIDATDASCVGSLHANARHARSRCRWVRGRGVSRGARLGWVLRLPGHGGRPPLDRGGNRSMQRRTAGGAEPRDRSSYRPHRTPRGTHHDLEQPARLDVRFVSVKRARPRLFTRHP